jgi:hypothetical protein
VRGKGVERTPIVRPSPRTTRDGHAVTVTAFRHTLLGLASYASGVQRYGTGTLVAQPVSPSLDQPRATVRISQAP